MCQMTPVDIHMVQFWEVSHVKAARFAAKSHSDHHLFCKLWNLPTLTVTRLQDIVSVHAWDERLSS